VGLGKRYISNVDWQFLLRTIVQNHFPLNAGHPGPVQKRSNQFACSDQEYVAFDAFYKQVTRVAHETLVTVGRQLHTGQDLIQAIQMFEPRKRRILG
jgi:hypothetical protein